jgi:hypothetical protein
MPSSTPKPVTQPATPAYARQLEYYIEELVKQLESLIQVYEVADTKERLTGDTKSTTTILAIKQLRDQIDAVWDDVQTIELARRAYAAMYQADNLETRRPPSPGYCSPRSTSPSPPPVHHAGPVGQGSWTPTLDWCRDNGFTAIKIDEKTSKITLSRGPTPGPDPLVLAKPSARRTGARQTTSRDPRRSTRLATKASPRRSTRIKTARAGGFKA